MSDRIVNEHLMSQMPEGHKLENGLIVPGSALPPVSRLAEIKARQYPDSSWAADIAWLIAEVERAGPPGEPSQQACARACQEYSDHRSPTQLGPTGCDGSAMLWALRAAYAIDGRGTATP